jgi:molecular chaperone HtpG
MREGKRGIQLYVKRVFIMDDCEELVPMYLRFVRGVVDAADLTLNVSREILQQDRHIQQMRKRLVKKILDTISEMQSDDPETYRKFWEQFGRALKEGIYQDPDQRDTLLKLSMFASTKDDSLTTLPAYVERMKAGQEAIYYLTGENRAAVENSPHLEAFKARGIEVLLLTDAIDEIWVESVPEFEGKKLQSAAKGDVALGTEEERKAAEAEQQEKRKDFATLLAYMATKLEAHVKEVRLSTRLTTSPACIVGDEHDVTPNLEKLMRAMGQEVPRVKRILELNPEHTLVQRLREVYDERKDDPTLAEEIELLYDLALLAEGGDLPDPARFSRLMADIMARAL